MNAIHHVLAALDSNRLRSVLATIVKVDGSAYRKAGTSALFFEDGTQVGVLGAGCVDIDVAARVSDILSRGVSQCVEYDLHTEDDFSWGKGPGCNGIIHVLLEPVHTALHHDLLKAKRHLDLTRRVSFLRELSSDGTVSQYVFMVDGEPCFGPWNRAIPSTLYEWCRALPPFSQSGAVGFSEGTLASVFVQCLWPKPRLILFGAGPDARPLSDFASKTGFSVTVCDWREAYTSASHFPDADTIQMNNLVDAVHQLRLCELDSVVIMTHSFEVDRDLLDALRHTKLLYLGVLGHRNRTARLLLDQSPLMSLHSPIGLSIGAEGPEEIAISVVAELIKAIRVSRGCSDL